MMSAWIFLNLKKNEKNENVLVKLIQSEETRNKYSFEWYNLLINKFNFIKINEDIQTYFFSKNRFNN